MISALWEVRESLTGSFDGKRREGEKARGKISRRLFGRLDGIALELFDGV